MLGTIEQMMADMKNGVFDFTKDGECSQCGACCTNLLPISKREYVQIRDYVERKHIPEYINRPPTNVPAEDWTCPFRDNEKRICTIYEVRPLICRDFRCDKPRKGIERNPEFLKERRVPVNVRETFYGKKGEKHGNKD